MYSPLCPSEGCGSQGEFKEKIKLKKLTDCLPLGVIASPNYPDSQYPRYLEKTDIIRVETEKILRLEFTFFEVGWGRFYCEDFVEITDGNGATLLEKTCGQTADSSAYDYFELPVIVTTTNTANISFYTDTNWDARRGWSLRWSAVTPGLRDFLANASLPSLFAKQFSQWG